MDTNDYIPRVLDEMPQPSAPLQTDSSKWVAVHHALENTNSHRTWANSGTPTLFTITWVLGITFGLVWILRNGRTVFDQWQQNVHRRANRRRHGIPDDDDRPFNVAYAAAALARQQREKEQKELEEATREKPQPAPDLKPQEEASGLRQRGLHAQDPTTSYRRQPNDPQWNSTNSTSDNPTGGGNRLQSRPQSSNPPSFQPPNLPDPYNANRDRSQGQRDAWSHAHGPSSRPSTASANSHKVLHNQSADHAQPERRKHRHVEDADDDDRTSKRTRVDGEEYIDGDNDAAWFPGGSRRGSLQVSKRGSKRHANPEDDDNWEMSQDKRARMSRMASQHFESDVEDISDVDMARKSSDADPEVTRGTKREREEADSAVGGAANDTDESPMRPSRRRRAEQRGNVEESSSRGLKRDQSPQRSTASDEGDEGSDPQMTSNKGVRRYEVLEPDADIVSSDPSESDDFPEVVEDPACGGREIGEIWEVNGQSFKVGMDGRRLRHALIRQQRNKFPMPKDSTHHDAKVNVEIVVEKWLNDDEYKAAKENLELAWQDASPTSSPNKAELLKQDPSPVSGGKRLLWGGPLPSPVKGRTSVPSAVTVQNPFELAPNNASRRVASGHLLLNTPAESPKLRSSKSFSKWEKQDLEASSLKKMRARMEKEKREKDKEQQKDQQEKEKKEKIEKINTAAPLAPSTPFAPTTNMQAQPPPLTHPNIETKPAPTTFGPTPSSVAPTPGPSSGFASGLTFAKPTSTPSAGSGTTSGMASQPPTASPFSIPTQSATTSLAITASSTAKPFSFAPPSASASTPSDQNKGGVIKPSFSFAPMSSTPSPAVSEPAKPVFGSEPPPALSAKNDTPKAPSFSFATPPISSTPPAEASKAVIPNFFAKPASQSASASSSAPMSNLPFSFAPKPQPSQGAPQQAPTFQFNPPVNTQNSPVPPGGVTNSGSLLGRLAPAPTSTQTPQTNSTALTGFSSFGGQATPFGTVSNPPATPLPATSIFGQSQSQPQQGFNTLSAAATKPTPFTPFTASEPSKNIFGQPSSSTPPAFSFAKPPATSEQPSSTPPTFSFAKPPATSEQPSFSTPPTFSFAKPPATSEQPSSSTPPAFSFAKPPATSEQPSSLTPPTFSFAKQPATSDPSKPASSLSLEKPGEQVASSTSQKPSFSFSFGTPGNSGGSNTSPGSNPFPFVQTPSTGAPAASRNAFAFGQPSSFSNTPPSTNTPGSTNNAAEGEKK